jgi:hypothetical protein
VNRRYSALILSGLGAGALYAATLGQPDAAPPPVDPAAVDAYLAGLSETVPPPPATALARVAQAPDNDNAKSAAKLDRAEPMVGAAFSIAR